MTVTVSAARQAVIVTGEGSVSVGGRGATSVTEEPQTVQVVGSGASVMVAPSAATVSVSSGSASQRQAYIDIRDYGAVGDDSTDCTEAFEAAFAEAGSDYFLGGGFEYPGSTGAQVLVPAGVFRHSDIVIPNNVTLTGLGRTTSALRPLSGTTVGVTVSKFACLRDLYIRGGGVSGDIVRVAGARSQVRDVHINGDNTSARGLAVFDSSGSSPFYAPQFSNLVIEAVNGNAVYVGVSDSQWVNIWVASGDGIGFYVAGTNTAVTNLHVWERGSYGVFLSASAASNRFVNSYIETNSRVGVICYGFENTFSTGRIWKNTDGGVQVISDQAGQTPMRNRFLGIEFRENKTTASVRFTGAYQNVVSGCIFSDPFFDATWAVQETDSAHVASDYNVIDNSNIIVSADFSSGPVSLVGAHSVNGAVVA